MSSDWGMKETIQTKTYTKSGSAAETSSQQLGEDVVEPNYEIGVEEEEATSNDSEDTSDINLPDGTVPNESESENQSTSEEDGYFNPFKSIGEFLGMDYTRHKRDATIWSSFYGGSAKHTKDHLGRLVNKIFPKTLTLDPHNRELATDSEGRVYKKGIWVDPENPENVKKSTAASIRDSVQGWINNSKLNGLIGDQGSWKKGVEYFSKGTPKIDGYDENGNPKIVLDDDGNPVIVKDGLDQKIANSWLGTKISDYNKKHGFDETKHGSTNQYRVGQNWSYGSVALYSKSWKPDRVSVLGVSGGLQNDYAYISGGVYLLTAKASANFEIGPDHIELSASAEASLLHVDTAMGASLTAGQALGEGFDWVPDDLVLAGANFTGSADLCKVYAKGKIGAGYYKGADGKMHLDAGIQGSIGADLCSATGTADVTVLGVNASVTGTVKIGIGAQANLGFEDGKLNVHLGVAFGVGVELGFSLDLSGAVEAGAEMLSDAWDWVTSW